MRFVYPPPRSTSTGIKSGPCGTEGFDIGEVTVFAANSTVRLEVIETIHHVGAPYRIALSKVMDDSFATGILLNHIPQHTRNAKATLFIDVAIPDVDCSSMCALQILSVMTDKIGSGSTCEYKEDGQTGSCFSNYHSCANVVISGTVARDQWSFRQPANWPYKDLERSMYTQESSEAFWCSVSENPLQLELKTDGVACNGIGISPTNPTETEPVGISPISPTETETDVSAAFNCVCRIHLLIFMYFLQLQVASHLWQIRA